MVVFHRTPELGFGVGMEEELFLVKALDAGNIILDIRRKFLDMALGTEKKPWECLTWSKYTLQMCLQGKLELILK